MTWTCGFCLNTGARPFGYPEKPSRVSEERWAQMYGGRKHFRGRWTRCLACNANFSDERDGPEIAASLTSEERVAILDSPSNRGF